MSDLARLYRTRVPKTLTLTVMLMVLLGVVVLATGLWSVWYGRAAFAASTELAQQGDFIGGHLAAVLVCSLSRSLSTRASRKVSSSKDFSCEAIFSMVWSSSERRCSGATSSMRTA